MFARTYTGSGRPYDDETILQLALKASELDSMKGANGRHTARPGTGLGAGVGAVGSAITGGSPVTGAVVGGAVGAAAGGLTSEKDVDLGKPAWRR